MVAMGYQEKRGAANILCVVEQEVFLLVGGEDITGYTECGRTERLEANNENRNN